jgi:hypothetical protein
VGLDTITTSAESRRKKYDNYEEGLSPRRKKKQAKIMEFGDFPEAHKQINKLLVEDYEFKTEIPNPDVQRIFVP